MYFLNKNLNPHTNILSIKNYKPNITYISMEHILLDDWQQKALNTKGHMLLCTGRQSGKTFLMARKASDYMLTHPNCRIIVVSLTEDQAELMIIMILDYLERNHKKNIGKGMKKPTKKRIFLKNNAMCLARPVGNTGDAVRGFRQTEDPGAMADPYVHTSRSDLA